MPKELVDKQYYTPTSMGYEKRIKDRLDILKNMK